MRRVGSQHLIECPVSFAIVPEIAENTLPRLTVSFSKMLICPQYPRQVYLGILIAFRLENTSFDTKFKVANFSFLLINQ